MWPSSLCNTLKYAFKSISSTAHWNELETVPKNDWVKWTLDVGGQRCPDYVRDYCAVFVSQNLIFSVGRISDCPDFEFELDFD